METKIFSAWSKLVEKFLKDVSTETVSYDALSKWIDQEGSKLFQGFQAENFEKNKKKYLENADSYPPPVRIDLAYEQVEYAFDKLFDKTLIAKFPSLQTERTKLLFTNFKNECLGEKFLPFIAARAVITAQMLRSHESDRLKNLKFTIEAFEFLESASKALIDSMKQYLPKLQPTIPRGSSSPLLHKAKEEAITTDKSSQTLDDSTGLKISRNR